MVKKCSTDPRFIRKRNTTYKIGTLANTNSYSTFRSKSCPHERKARRVRRGGGSNGGGGHRCILGMHFEHDNCPIALEFIEICMHTCLCNSAFTETPSKPLKRRRLQDETKLIFYTMDKKSYLLFKVMTVIVLNSRRFEQQVSKKL